MTGPRARFWRASMTSPRASPSRRSAPLLGGWAAAANPRSPRTRGSRATASRSRVWWPSPTARASGATRCRAVRPTRGIWAMRLRSACSPRAPLRCSSGYAAPERMLPLHGVGVLVTRPRQQASALCRLLEAQGARTFCLPAIEIKPMAESRLLAARLGELAEFDLIIFTSANAVRFGAALLEQRRDLPLAAIGPATARALNQAGYRVMVQPTDGFDSENLLQHPRLAAMAGKRILLMKGSGGRELLQDEFTRRGAHVTIAEVYRR